MRGPHRPDRSRRSATLGVGAAAVVLAAGIGGYVLVQPGGSDLAGPAHSPNPAVTSARASATPAGSVRPSSSPSQDPAIRAVSIRSVPNFRDVAGDAIPLDNGARMATGVVYRSGKLTALSKADRRRLARAGLSDIFDLRTPYVAQRSPDPDIPGANYHLINIYAVDRTSSSPQKTTASAKEHMRDLNRGFVSDPAQRKRVASVLMAIAEADAPVLVHCTEGKDRTGWISAMLQLVAGADHDTVLDQYLLSNRERAEEIETAYARVKRESGVEAAEIDRALKTVEASYLQAGLSEVEARYGSLEGYLSEGLALTEETLHALRSRLRVEPSR